MASFWKGARMWTFGIVVGLYTTFVLQCFWNWFVAPTFNIAPISYWQLYGLNMLVQMLMERTTFVEEDRWKRALTMLYASVPIEKKDEIDEVLKSENDDVWWKVGSEIFSKLVGNTVGLVVGWAVHTFLV